MWFDHPLLRQLIDLALAEDVGNGDHATQACLDPQRQGTAHVRAKSPLVVCGAPLFAQIMQRVEPSLRVEIHVGEGQRAAAGQVVLSVHGSLAAILTGERTALNFMQRLSGIASVTSAYVQAVAGTKAQITDTRKTLPGFRSLDKYAVRCGGGRNHRTALDAGILIKENHTHAAGSIAKAVAAARQVGSHLLKVEVEVETLADLDAALLAGADVILLDNMDLAQLRQAVQRTAGRALLEASGNMTLERVRQVAETGVDLISVGALTHSVVAADLSLRIQGAESPR
ncbi:MAG: carboxylating nicotinate-nucleotide diphosphorylase [Deltaproteobacteria bacterium]|nr:carboxylating nicotinate-nucleotide diphosphorylase [Deltaproteobacteria bacterium]